MTTPEEFNQSLRDLIESVRVADLQDVDLRAAQQALGQVQATIAPHVVEDERMQVSLFRDGDRQPGDPIEGGFVDPAAFFPYSPVVGALNAMSMPATFDVIGGEIHGTVTLGARYNGPPGSVHGGMIALVMDELLGCTVLANGVGGFTGTLSVRYQSTVPLDTEVQLRGWIDRTEGRKSFAVGEIRLDDQVLTRAEGVFIQPR